MNIEQLVKEAIDCGKTHARYIEGYVARCLPGQTINFRTIDRAIQRLRKKGEIAYAGQVHGWKLTDPTQVSP